jgi:hypothetical protein
MQSRDDRPEGPVTWGRSKPPRVRMDCRECGAICERLVSPWRCLRSHCAYVYAYEDCGTTYFGCLRKVFAPELDLSAFVDESGEVCRSSDPYGPIRATRAPRMHCPMTIERAYQEVSREECRNPSFLRWLPAVRGSGGAPGGDSRVGWDSGAQS